MISRNTNIAITVKENRLETHGYRSVVFNHPKEFDYNSGDWIDIQFGSKDLKGGKTYSLSSSPTDSDLMITFKDGLSEIKRELAALKVGDKLNIIQYGNDHNFTLKPHKASTLIAGGVGIAPFRSMIKEMTVAEDKNEVNLIYLNQTAEFLFEDELSTWVKHLNGLTITYIVTKGLKSKDRNKAILLAVKSTQQSFYIAGPEAMVEATEHLLLDYGVSISDIKIDSFGGY
jgi:ferredoxin-NADP reductase